MQVAFLGLFRSSKAKQKLGFLVDNNLKLKLDRNKYRKYLKKPELDQIMVIVGISILFILDVLQTCLSIEYQKFFGVNMYVS